MILILQAKKLRHRWPDTLPKITQLLNGRARIWTKALDRHLCSHLWVSAEQMLSACYIQGTTETTILILKCSFCTSFLTSSCFSLINSKVSSDSCLTSRREREGQISMLIQPSFSFWGYLQVTRLLLKWCSRKQAEIPALAALLLTNCANRDEPRPQYWLHLFTYNVITSKGLFGSTSLRFQSTQTE